MADYTLGRNGLTTDALERLPLNKQYLEAQIALASSTDQDLLRYSKDVTTLVQNSLAANTLNVPAVRRELHRLTKNFRDAFYKDFMDSQDKIMEIKAEAELTALTRAQTPKAAREALAAAWEQIRKEEIAKLPKREWDDSIGVLNRIKSVEDSMNKVVIGIVQDSVKNGRSAQETVRSIQHYVRPFPGYRDKPPKYYAGLNKKVRYGSAEYNALRIARTESARTFSEIHMRYYDKFDFVVGYRWILSNRHRGTDVCDSRAGQVYTKDNMPTRHPMCLCDLLTVIDREKAYNLTAKQVEDIFA